jgi:carbamoyl-phosphate synthase large subunit
MKNILITGVGSTTAISVIKGLRKQQEIPVRIIGTDIHDERQIAGSSFCDVFHKVPKAIDDNYIGNLLDISLKEKVDVLFPILDKELEVIAASINRFREAGIHVWLSDLESILICGDKYRTYQFFVDNGFPTPMSWLPEKMQTLDTQGIFPLIVKPRSGLGSVDVFRVDDWAELQSALERVEEPVIQEYLHGKEFTIDVVADNDSRILAVVPRERIETKAGISYKGRTVRDEQLIQYAGDIAQKLQIKGHCNVQCRMTNGAPKFFEVNPRFSGTLPLTIEAGVNSPLILAKLALGIKPERDQFDFRDGVYMARYWAEIFYHE